MKPAKQWPKGVEIAERSGCQVIIGPVNAFNYLRGIITLTADVYMGRDAVALLIAAHELAHTRQSRLLHLIADTLSVPYRLAHLCVRGRTATETLRPTWNPLHWWLEANAWESAAQMLVDLSRAER